LLFIIVKKYFLPGSIPNHQQLAYINEIIDKQVKILASSDITPESIIFTLLGLGRVMHFSAPSDQI